MATSNTITLDGSTYAVLLNGYRPWYMKGERNTLTSTGKDDTVYPANAQEGWDLVLKCTYTQLSSLLTTWAKTVTVSFTDPLGSSHTVRCLDAIRQETLTPMLDGSNSYYYVPVRLKVNVS